MVGLVASAHASTSELLSHRAVYDLNLVEAQNDSGIDFANGLFIFEVVGSSCAGWNMASDMILSLEGRGGGAVNTQTSYRAFEDGQGQVFTFQTNTETNEEEPVLVTGAAERAAAGELTIRRFAAEQTSTTAVEETLFPNQLTEAVLEAALAGDPLLFTSVFDGSHQSGQAQPATVIIGTPAMPTVVAPIGSATQAAADEEGPESWEDFPTPTRAWPVTLSYFDPEEADAGPSFIVSYTLDTNGVSDALLLDYGSFTLSGTLVDFMAYETQPCRD